MGIIQPAQIKSCAICSTHAPFAVLLVESCCGVNLEISHPWGTWCMQCFSCTLFLGPSWCTPELKLWQRMRRMRRVLAKLCCVARWKRSSKPAWNLLDGEGYDEICAGSFPESNGQVAAREGSGWFGCFDSFLTTGSDVKSLTEVPFVNVYDNSGAPELQKTLHTMDGNGLKHLAIPFRSSGVGSATFWITKCNYSNNFFVPWETPSSLKLFFYV